MRLVIPITAALALSGCQMYGDDPTRTLMLTGGYQEIADCFYLHIRKEGMWSKDDMDSMRMSRVIMGTIRFDAGVIEFRDKGNDQTEVTFKIAHPNKFEPKIRECAA